MKRTDPYTGPFPRKRHSHKCKNCVTRGQINAVACYKQHCTRPQLTDTCPWCAPLLPDTDLSWLPNGGKGIIERLTKESK